MLSASAMLCLPGTQRNVTFLMCKVIYCFGLDTVDFINVGFTATVPDFPSNNMLRAARCSFLASNRLHCRGAARLPPSELL